MPTASIIDRVIGIRLRAERLSRQHDAASFARDIGVTPERLEAFETGLARIDAHTMLAICARFDVGARHFFEPRIEKPSNYPLAAE